MGAARLPDSSDSAYYKLLSRCTAIYFTFCKDFLWAILCFSLHTCIQQLHCFLGFINSSWLSSGVIDI
jgi:hypothetical protein